LRLAGPFPETQPFDPDIMHASRRGMAASVPLHRF